MQDLNTIISRLNANDSTLTSLNFGGYRIGDRGAIAIARALETNTTLTSLNLTFNEICLEGTQALAKALETNMTLTSLYLGANNIGESGVKVLATALKINRTLASLDLEESDIGDIGTMALAAALQTNTALISLELWNNKINDMGAEILATALRTNTTLTSLYLNNNRIGDIGTMALAAALQTNTTLTSLNIAGNRIGEAGAKALTAALQTNTTLTSLNLRNNKIGGVGAEALHEIKQHLSRNQSLKLKTNELTETFSKQLHTQDISNIYLTSMDENIAQVLQLLQSSPSHVPAKQLLTSIQLMQQALSAWVQINTKQNPKQNTQQNIEQNAEQNTRQNTQRMNEALNALNSLQSTTPFAKACLIFWGKTFAEAGDLETAIPLLLPQVDHPKAAQCLIQHLLALHSPDKPLLTASRSALSPGYTENYTCKFFGEEKSPMNQAIVDKIFPHLNMSSRQALVRVNHTWDDYRQDLLIQSRKDSLSFIACILLKAENNSYNTRLLDALLVGINAANGKAVLGGSLPDEQRKTTLATLKQRKPELLQRFTQILENKESVSQQVEAELLESEFASQEPLENVSNSSMALTS